MQETYVEAQQKVTVKHGSQIQDKKSFIYPHVILIRSSRPSCVSRVQHTRTSSRSY
jgi:hypothetical protein